MLGVDGSLADEKDLVPSFFTLPGRCQDVLSSRTERNGASAMTLEGAVVPCDTTLKSLKCKSVLPTIGRESLSSIWLMLSSATTSFEF